MLVPLRLATGSVLIEFGFAPSEPFRAERLLSKALGLAMQQDAVALEPDLPGVPYAAVASMAPDDSAHIYRAADVGIVVSP